MRKRNEKSSENSIEKVCAYCRFASVLEDGGVCICQKHGAVRADSSCRKFKVDLLKLKPHLPLLPGKERDDLFSI